MDLNTIKIVAEKLSRFSEAVETALESFKGHSSTEQTRLTIVASIHSELDRLFREQVISSCPRFSVDFVRVSGGSAVAVLFNDQDLESIFWELL